MKETTRHVIDRLKKYKQNSSTIETTLARIETYENALRNPTSYTHLSPSSQSDMGSIKGKGGKPSSPVEQALVRKEGNEQEVMEHFREWIKEDKSRIYPLQIEKEQIDGALNALTKEQKHVIECKYFENMIWKDIAESVNDKFRKQNCITGSGAKKINLNSVEIIVKILKLHYSRMNFIE